MKMINIVYKIILVMILIIICSSSMSLAKQTVIINDGGGTGSYTYTDPDLPNLNGDYKPTIGVGTGGNTVKIIGKILGILTVVGVVVSVIGLTLVGFNSILGSASEKAANQEKYVGIVIAAMVITGGSVIAGFIIKSAENLI